MLDATMEAGRVDIDDEADPVVERHRERLGAPIRRSRPSASGCRRECLRSASAIAANVSYVPWMMPCADVDPRSGGHLPIHRQSRCLRRRNSTTAQSAPGWAGDQHRGAHCGSKTPTGRPDRTSIVSSGPKRRQGPHYRVKAAPIARRSTGAAIDDEVVGSLGDLRSRLFINIRSGASVAHDRAVSVVPRAARTGLAPSIGCSLRFGDGSPHRLIPVGLLTPRRPRAPCR